MEGQHRELHIDTMRKVIRTEVTARGRFNLFLDSQSDASNQQPVGGVGGGVSPLICFKLQES